MTLVKRAGVFSFRFSFGFGFKLRNVTAVGTSNKGIQSDPLGGLMQARLDYSKVAPGTLKAMMGLETYVRHCGLETSLLELVKVRASQINGCAYCVDMHTKDARAEGETEQRLYAVAVWREAPFFTDRERAALAWTEAVTLIGQTGAPDDVYQQVRRYF